MELEPQTRVFNKKTDGFNSGDSAHVYIGRASRGLKESIFHNPFKMKNRSEAERTRVVTEYAKHAMTNPAILSNLWRLKGKCLFCWCAPKMCHGHILVWMINKYSEIEYVTGDASLPQQATLRTWNIIAHICNNRGSWGKGFVVPLGQRYPNAMKKYLEESQQGKAVLGTCSSVVCENTGKYKLGVVNMVAQDGFELRFTADGTKPPVDYESVDKCLETLCGIAITMHGAEIHMPRIGCGLGGGEWSVIEKLIKQRLSRFCIRVIVYDLPAK